MEFDFEPIVSDNANISDNVNNAEIKDDVFFGYLNDAEKNTILKGVEGHAYNRTGDIVDKDNKVIYTVKDLRDGINTFIDKQSQTADISEIESLEIDGTDYSINDAGEAIDAEGKIIKTAEEVLAILADIDTPAELELDTIFTEANVITGYDLNDENGNPLTFEPTLEGMAKRDQALVNIQGRKIAVNALGAIFESKPEVKEVYEYLELNGSLDGFSFGEKKLDIQIDPKNDNQHRDIIVRAQRMRGNSAEAAIAIADSFINDGKGSDMAKAELEFVNDKIDTINTERTAQLERKQLAEQQKQQATFNAVKAIVDSGTIGDIPIPAIIKTKDAKGNLVQKSRADFFNYYTQNVGEGKTQYEIDMTNKSNESKLVDALIAFTGNNKTDLIKGAANTQAIKIKRKTKDTSSSSTTLRNAGGKIDPSKIKL